jgi:hypothetical protein
MLYSQYSNLAFSRITDRPFAISGLEQRLIGAFETKGGYGVFDKFFERGLLWQRAGREFGRILNLVPKMPSWSWMAYYGGIEYIAVPFGYSEWNGDLLSPFQQNRDSMRAQWHTADVQCVAVKASARRFASESAIQHIVLDEPSRRLPLELLRCVVVGTLRQLPGNIKDQQKNYVLAIMPTTAGEGCKTYERVGAGILERRDIDFQSSLEKVFIQ